MGEEPAPSLDVEPQVLCHTIEETIRTKQDTLSRSGAILGVSGGLDSAVVAYLAGRALGPQQVRLVHLPDKHSSPQSARDAALVAEGIGATLIVEDITPKLSHFGTYRLIPRWLPGWIPRRILGRSAGGDREHPFSSGLEASESRVVGAGKAFYRAKHRTRTVTLYYQAEQRNLLVLGAANRTEISIGLFVNHGCDCAADVLPIARLYKTQIRQLGEYLGIPTSVLDKAPSPDLISGVTDEYVIGVEYETIDRILVALEAGMNAEDVGRQAACDGATVDYVQTLVERSQHRREIPYVVDP